MTEDWLDHLHGTHKKYQTWWEGIFNTNKFDQRIIKGRLEELKTTRAEGNVDNLLYYFSEGVHGNMASMGAPELYDEGKDEDKELVGQYIQELVEGLQQIADLPDNVLGLQDKIDFFSRTSQAHGKSALMLSGAGSLAPFHLGVCRSLFSQNLLPKIISGSSAGAIIAAIFCSYNDQELEELLEPIEMERKFKAIHDGYSKNQTMLDADDVLSIIDAWIPDITFAEAFKRTGRYLSISVAPAELHQQSRTLNSITTPNVLLRETIQASCAIPGIMKPVTLAAKNPEGDKVPYVKSRSWIDGSVTDDLPANRLRRIFGCNFFITSQTNPLVLWSISSPRSASAAGDFYDFWQTTCKEWVKTVYPHTQHYVQNLYPLNVMTRMWYSMFTQDYTADVNILPKQKLVEPTSILEKISPEKAMELVVEGERQAKPSIERIRNCTKLGAKLDWILNNLAKMNPCDLKAENSDVQKSKSNFKKTKVKA